MRLRFGCEGCDASIDAPLTGGTVACGECGRRFEPAPRERFAPDGPVVRCPLCPGDDLYLQRDFPRRAGLAVMGLGALAFLVLAGTGRPMAGFAVLGGVAALDLVLFRFLPVVTVCYRCGAEVRGAPANPALAPFDHHLAETAAKRAAVDRANRSAAGAAHG